MKKLKLIFINQLIKLILLAPWTRPSPYQASTPSLPRTLTLLAKW
jgi:hypothetical protein